MRRQFPTFRAWRISLNRNAHLGRAVLAFYASGILLFLPLCFAASKLRALRQERTNISASSESSAAKLHSGPALEFPDDLLPLLAFGAAGLGAVSFAGWSIGQGLSATRREVALLRDSASTVGTIVSVERSTGTVEYRYSAVIATGESLRTFSAEQSILSRFRRVAPGDAVRVVYDPREPETSVLDLDRLRDDDSKKAKRLA